MNKKISLGAALALMLIITAVTFSVTMIFSRQMFSTTITNISEKQAMYDKLSEIDSYVRQNFYGSIDETNLNDYISTGYIAGLSDRYAAYYSASDYATLQQENAGQLVGIGIRATKNESGFIEVTEVYPDSPAREAGIQAGDLIVKVNDIDVTNDTYESAITEIGGQAGTKLSLTVRRDNTDQEIAEITRRVVVTPTVYSRMINNAGYIRITDFNENTYDQLRIWSATRTPKRSSLTCATTPAAWLTRPSRCWICCCRKAPLPPPPTGMAPPKCWAPPTPAVWSCRWSF